MKTIALWLLMGGAAYAAPVDRVLAGVEHVPTAEEARSVGAQALIDYAADAHHPVIRRVRAISALRFVPGEPARAWLVDLLAREGKSAAGAAALEVSAALGALVPYGRSELVLPYVTHASADVRQSAAAALGLIADPTALGILRARSVAERDPGVRAVIERSLARR